MKDFLSLAKERYSVRAYTGQPVEQEKLAAILEAGRVAPTAHNNQPQRVMVVQSAAGREKLSRAVLFFNLLPVGSERPALSVFPPGLHIPVQ